MGKELRGKVVNPRMPFPIQLVPCSLIISTDEWSALLGMSNNASARSLVRCADAPSPGGRGRVSSCALSRTRRARSASERASDFGLRTSDADEEDEARYADTHERVARVLLAHHEDESPGGETAVGKVARLLARTLRLPSRLPDIQIAAEVPRP